jgi:hypothetical protein
MSKRHYMGRESIPVTHHFTEDELKSFAQEMAAGLEDAAKIESEKKFANEGFKERLGEAESKAANAGKKYRAGKETVYVHCNKVADYETGEIHWSDPDTGEVLQRRRMTDEERKIPLMMEPEPFEDEEGEPLAIIDPHEAAAKMAM